MKLLVLKGEEISKVITMREAIEADKEALSIYSKGGATIPLRINLELKKSGWLGSFR